MAMKNVNVNRSLLGLASLAILVVAYTLISNAERIVGPSSLPPMLRSLLRPEVIPPTQSIAEAFTALVAGASPKATSEGQVHAGHHMHSSDHVEVLLQQGVTLQASLAITTARGMFGLAVGAPLGILIGLFMGLNRRADDYLHPLSELLRSVPPLALITYIMLWLGHSEAHRLIPIVYAVAVTAVIPTYHGVRDVAAKYLVAARSLGARGRLLLAQAILPAAGPAVLGGVRD